MQQHNALPLLMVVKLLAMTMFFLQMWSITIQYLIPQILKQMEMEMFIFQFLSL